MSPHRAAAAQILRLRRLRVQSPYSSSHSRRGERGWGPCCAQDNVHKAYPDTGALWSMCWMNFWCSLYNCAYLFGITSAGWELLAFCRQHPEVWFFALLRCPLFPFLLTQPLPPILQ